MTRLLAAIFLLSAVSSAQPATGNIQGTLTDSKGKPVSGGFVKAIRSGLPPASQVGTSAKDGSFQVQGLPAGTYSMCAQVRGDGYLDPCLWSTPKKVALTAGQTSSGNIVTLGDSSIVKIRVDDPNKLLGQKTRDGRMPHLLIGIWGGNGIFLPAHLDSSDNSGAQYQLSIPRDTNLKLQVSSRDLKLVDATGTALTGAGDQQQFQHKTGDSNPKSFKYTITGVNP